MRSTSSQAQRQRSRFRLQLFSICLSSHRFVDTVIRHLARRLAYTRKFLANTIPKYCATRRRLQNFYIAHVIERRPFTIIALSPARQGRCVGCTNNPGRRSPLPGPIGSPMCDRLWQTIQNLLRLTFYSDSLKQFTQKK